MTTSDYHSVDQSRVLSVPSRFLGGLPSRELTTGGYGRDEKRPSGPTDRCSHALDSVDTAGVFHHLDGVHYISQSTAPSRLLGTQRRHHTFPATAATGQTVDAVSSP